MTVIGIDPSSKKLAFISSWKNSNFFQFYKVSLPGDILQATGAAFEEAYSIFEGYPGDVAVYMEAPVVGRNIHSTIVQAQVGGAVMAAAHQTGVKLFLVNNTSWKKQVLGMGNAGKTQISAWLEENWPEAYNLAGRDQDLIDAACISRYGVHHQRLIQAIQRRKSRAQTEAKPERRALRRP